MGGCYNHFHSGWTEFMTDPLSHAHRLADRVAAVCLLAAALSLVYSLVTYWGSDLSALDRYLITGGTVWVGATVGPAAVCRRSRPLPWCGLTLVTLAAVLYLPVWFLTFGSTAGRVVLLWWQWSCLGGAAGGYALARFGPATVRAGLFPAIFLAFALPLPTAVEGPLQNTLQRATTAAAFAVLHAGGSAVERPGGGFVLHLPGGDLGVEEACSGVRSLTALTALAAFVAFRRGFGPVRGVALVGATVPIVVGVNVVRVVLSGVIQEAIGGAYIRGGWHDALGLAMVLVGLGGICLVAGWLGRGGAKAAHPAAPNDATGPADAVALDRPVRPRWGPAAAAVVLVIGGVGAAVGGWRAAPPGAVDEPAPDLTAVPHRLGDWAGEDRPVPEHIVTTLQSDVALHREYRNGTGQRATVWVLYWAAAGRVRGYHHPDVCLPNAGLTPVERGAETIWPTAGGEVPVTARTLAGDRGRLYALYWTQEGRRVWGEADEQAAAAGLGVRGLVARLRDTTAPPAGGRLVVLVGTEDASTFGRGEALSLARSLADEVYRLCPWASPPEVSRAEAGAPE